MADQLLKCPYHGPCCMRTRRGECEILADVHFDDGVCHFQKPTPDSPNTYDEKKLFGSFLGKENLEYMVEKRRRLYAELRELEEDIREMTK